MGSLHRYVSIHPRTDQLKAARDTRTPPRPAPRCNRRVAGPQCYGCSTTFVKPSMLGLLVRASRVGRDIEPGHAERSGRSDGADERVQNGRRFLARKLSCSGCTLPICDDRGVMGWDRSAGLPLGMDEVVFASAAGIGTAVSARSACRSSGRTPTPRRGGRPCGTGPARVRYPGLMSGPSDKTDSRHTHHCNA